VGDAMPGGTVGDAMPGGTVGDAMPPGTVGDELMRIVARARSADADPEFELRAAARRFAERVRDWERSRQGLAAGLRRLHRQRAFGAYMARSALVAMYRSLTPAPSSDMARSTVP